MDSISITTDETTGLLVVVTPYDQQFVRLVKAAGGRWDGDKKVWVVDERSREQVEDALTRVFGWSPAATGTVTVRTVLDWHNADSAEVRLAGRTIARRRGRDQDVVLGNGVAVIEGTFASSAGSMRRPEVIDDSGTRVVLEVRDVPAGVLDVESDLHLEVIDQDSPDPAALRAELATLQARIEQIHRTLAELDN